MDIRFKQLSTHRWRIQQGRVPAGFIIRKDESPTETLFEVHLPVDRESPNFDHYPTFRRFEQATGYVISRIG
jgi:hypothetical protein